MGYEETVEKLVTVAKESLGIFIEPAKKILDGIIIDPTKKIIDAKTEMYIEKQKLRNKHDIKRIDLTERSKTRLLETEITRQFNLEQTFSQAAQLLPENATPENINKDWLHHFVTSSQDVSEEDLRNIWARLLAGEATNPGKFSKRTLDYLKNFSVSDCKLFEKILPFIFRDKNLVFFIDPYFETDKFLEKFNIELMEFDHLQSIGIIGNEKGFSITDDDINNGIEWRYFDKKVKISIMNTEKTVITHVFTLTEVGSQLSNVVYSAENIEYLNNVVVNISNKYKKNRNNLRIDRIYKDCA